MKTYVYMYACIHVYACIYIYICVCVFLCSGSMDEEGLAARQAAMFEAAAAKRRATHPNF
jgi:hypothetical protein